MILSILFARLCRDVSTARSFHDCCVRVWWGAVFQSVGVATVYARLSYIAVRVRFLFWLRADRRVLSGPTAGLVPSFRSEYHSRVRNIYSPSVRFWFSTYLARSFSCKLLQYLSCPVAFDSIRFYTIFPHLEIKLYIYFLRLTSADFLWMQLYKFMQYIGICSLFSERVMNE